MQKNAFDCLALTLVPGLGRSRIQRLLDSFQEPGRILAMSRSRLERLNLPFEAQAFIAGGCARQAAQEAVRTARQKGWRILSIFDDDYPPLLKQIVDPPLILYCQGEVELLSRPAVSIVGTRLMTVYGRQHTEMIARQLARCGLTIVSGLARGIDSAAHRGCLEAGGKTAAVLGNGLDVVYPKQNRLLYRRIAKEGCLVSEFPAGCHPAPQNFPIRNRIISGLSYGTLVTEAAKSSGSLITAGSALSQNREVWALPGNVSSPGSFGPNHLIQEGAYPVHEAQDLINRLPYYVLEMLDNAPEEPASAPQQANLNQHEKTVLKLLSSDADLHFDRIAQDSGMSAPQLNQTLFQLEMAGLVEQGPGRCYSLRLR